VTQNREQGFWETPRNLAIWLGAAVVITAAVAGALGYKIGQTPTQPIIINLPPQAPQQ
jgi:purine-cytosine permease-like protein